MSCRHDLANGTCITCYPTTGKLDPGPGPHLPNLDGPGAVPAKPGETLTDLPTLLDCALCGNKHHDVRCAPDNDAPYSLNSDYEAGYYLVQDRTGCCHVKSKSLRFLDTVIAEMLKQGQGTIGYMYGKGNSVSRVDFVVNDKGLFEINMHEVIDIDEVNPAEAKALSVGLETVKSMYAQTSEK